jgi:hypothetical protein
VSESSTEKINPSQRSLIPDFREVKENSPLTTPTQQHGKPQNTVCDWTCCHEGSVNYHESLEFTLKPLNSSKQGRYYHKNRNKLQKYRPIVENRVDNAV